MSAPNALRGSQKLKRMQTGPAFDDAICHNGKAMGETMVPLYNSETKRHSKEWVRKGDARPHQGKGPRQQEQEDGARLLRQQRGSSTPTLGPRG